MKRNIFIGQENIEYTIKLSNRARLIRLVVHNNGNVVVTCPKHVDENSLKKYIVSKSSWIIKKISYFKQNPKMVLSKGGRKEYLLYKERARILVQERLTYFNKFYNYNWKRIAIRDTKSRWGSCSKRGNLNFSYKLVLLPQELSDYIIVHELCHLREMNHSNNFWGLVSRTILNHQSLRKKLKTIL